MASPRTVRGTSRRVVLVDMDDTLFDHSLTCRAAIAELRRERAFLRRQPLEQLWREYLRQLESTWATLSPTRAAIDEARRERWRRLALSCGATPSEGEVAALSRTYRRQYQRLRRPVPGTRALLARLHRRAPVVIVTNNELAEQEEKVRFLGIGEHIDGLVVSETVGVGKPDARIFQAALRAVGARPHEATMLGDSWANDVVGARRARIRPVWFNRFGVPPPGRGTVAELRSLRPSGPAMRLLLGDDGPAPRAPRSRRL